TLSLHIWPEVPRAVCQLLPSIARGQRLMPVNRADASRANCPFAATGLVRTAAGGPLARRNRFLPRLLQVIKPQGPCSLGQDFCLSCERHLGTGEPAPKRVTRSATPDRRGRRGPWSS